MEDALALFLLFRKCFENGLNPCFNGRCTRTSSRETLLASAKAVLILVLMEDALAREKNWGKAKKFRES